MVLTRRQEQLLHTPPPPAVGGGQPGGEPSPATPAGAVAAAAQANGRALPLKSALKTGRKLRPSGPGEEESTPVGAGIKKRVRIHSSSNLVHEFTTSHSTDQGWALMDYAEEEEEEVEEEQQESGSDGEHGSADGTPDSGGARRSRTRRRTPRDAPSFLALLLFGDGRSGRGGARRGSRRRSSNGAWLGVLFTLAWMAASSALIFINKVLMVSRRGGCWVIWLAGVEGGRRGTLEPLSACLSFHLFSCCTPWPNAGGPRLPLPVCPHRHGPGGICAARCAAAVGRAGKPGRRIPPPSAGQLLCC